MTGLKIAPLICLLGLVLLLTGCPKEEGPAPSEKAPNVGAEPSEAPAKRGPEAAGQVKETEPKPPQPATEAAEPKKEAEETKKGLALSDVEVDCQKVCDYQFGCAAEALKAVGKPPVETDQADAKNACKMACDAAMKSGQPLAMRNYQASTACLEQKCGKEHTLCLTSLIRAAQ